MVFVIDVLPGIDSSFIVELFTKIGRLKSFLFAWPNANHKVFSKQRIDGRMYS